MPLTFIRRLTALTALMFGFIAIAGCDFLDGPKWSSDEPQVAKYGIKGMLVTEFHPVGSPSYLCVVVRHTDGIGVSCFLPAWE